MFDNTITLYNYHEATDSWYLTVISGVDCGAAHKQSQSASVDTTNGDTVQLLVPCGVDKSIGGKVYLPPTEYANCEDPSGSFTFAPGTDFFSDHAVSDLTPVLDSQFDSGYYGMLNEQLYGIYKIQSAEFFGLLPHWEIGGR